MELVGTTVSEMQTALTAMENSIGYGERARLQIISDESPSRQDLSEFYYGLVSAGFHTSKPVTRIVSGLPSTEITLTKGSPLWPLLIPLIPTALIVGLITFGIVKIEEISKALVPLLLIGGGVVIAVVAAVAASPKVTGIAEEAIRRRR